MKTTTILAVAIGLGLTAGNAQAQSLLEGMARRALGSAATEVLGRAVAGRAQPTEPSTSEPPQPSGPARARGRREPRQDNAPQAEGMQGLSDSDRMMACTARYPTAGLTGDAYMKRSADHAACMPPGWGEGG